MSNRVRALPFLVVLVFSLVSFFTPGGDLPTGVSIWDKLGHALAFGGLALTGRIAGLGAGRLLVGLLGYGTVVELLQWLLPIHRSGDWHDVVADLVGVVAGLVLVELLVRARESSRRAARTRARADRPEG